MSLELKDVSLRLKMFTRVTRVEDVPRMFEDVQIDVEEIH